MTLGLSKTTHYLFDLNKNESKNKKRKLDEVMNGRNSQTIGSFRNDIHYNQSEDESIYSIPSKRLRIQITPNNSLNTNNKHKNRNPMKLLSTLWNKIRGTNGKKETIDETSTQEPQSSDRSSDNSLIRLTSNSDSTKMNKLFTNTTNESFLSKTNPAVNTNVANESLGSTQAITCEVRRKRTFNTFRLDEKQKYRQLLSRHLSPFNLRSTSKKDTKKPEIIDLSSSVSSAQPSVTKHVFPSTREVFTTEVLNNNKEKTNLVERIKSAGLYGPNSVKVGVNHSTPFFANSYPKLNLFSTPKTSESNESQTKAHNLCESRHPLPESSKKFNELITTKKDYLNNDFIADLRNSLTQSTERNERKILKTERMVLESKQKRESDCQTLCQKLRKPFTRSEFLPFIPYFEVIEPEEEVEEDVEEEEVVSTDLPTLTPEMDQEINDALRPTPQNQVLCEAFSLQICRKDMETLNGLNWLNDEIINFYLQLIVERGKNDNFSTVHAFNTFFYKKLKDNGPKGLMRWTRRVDIFTNDFIFIPIHLGMHWCLAVIDFLHKRIQYYDSMGGNNFECVEALKGYLQSERLDKKKEEFPMTDWTLEMVKDIPQQMNGSDCGMFTCKYAEYISRKAKITFSQAQMPYFRRRMVYEILTKQLL